MSVFKIYLHFFANLAILAKMKIDFAQEQKPRTAILVAPNVKCTVCNQIFCCAVCRQKHEHNTHSDVNIRELGQIKNCALCKGFPAVLLESVDADDDAAFVKHLCERHLPLHCKKCSKVFNSPVDFQDILKCLEMDKTRCNLVSSTMRTTINNSENKTIESPKENSSADASNINYVTAIDGVCDGIGKLSSGSVVNEIENAQSSDSQSLKQVTTAPVKTNLDPNFSDSVYSIRNFSSILHASGNNHTIYRSQSPTESANRLVRQTSTPMLRPEAISTSPVSIGSSIHCSNNASSASDVSIEAAPPAQDPSEPFVQCIGPTVQSPPARKLNSRNKVAVSATPLRQVLSKSLHRALREQIAGSPTSPLDLRMSPVIRRTNSDPVQQAHRHHFKATLQQPSQLVQVGSLSNLDQRPKFLETVYEAATNYKELRSGSAKPALDIPHKPPQHKPPQPKQLINSIAATAAINQDIAENEEDHLDDGAAAAEVWHTPSEFPSYFKPGSTDYEEKTPVLPALKHWPRKRSINRFKKSINEDPIDASKTSADSENSSISKSKSKFWSFISSVLRFSPKDDTNPELLKQDSLEADQTTSFVIKRCASYTGISQRDTLSPENYDLQPTKRRRTTSVNGSLGYSQQDIYRRIESRQPIARMRPNP